MRYEYRCEDCEVAYELQTFTPIGSRFLDGYCSCGGFLVRMASLFNVTPPVDAYWNYTLGEMVTDSKDFERKLKVAERTQSERLGYEQTFTPVYPHERQTYAESTASADGANGESVEKYGRLYNLTNKKRTIL